MRNSTLLFLSLAIFTSSVTSAQTNTGSETRTPDAEIDRTATPNLIPKPVSMTPVTGKLGGKFILPQEGVGVGYFSVELCPLVDYLAEYVNVNSRFCAAGANQLLFAVAGTPISLKIDREMKMPAGGYRLEVAVDGTEIRGVDYEGVMNGIQTFLQLLPAEVYGRPAKRPDWVIDTVVIEDFPRFSYRGVMLDVARTFVPKEEVMRLIDNLSRHKINKLHWHLADDEGWRIEIKSFPKLTEIGAWRGGFAGNTEPVKAVYGAWDGRHGGFYTQDDIRRVVEYAAVRGVEIIPEIDLPGHSRAAAIAYPEILCNYRPDLKVSAGYDVRNVFCAAREENYAMLDSIIREVSALFPSEHFMLGGDEVEPAQWKKCPDCKALMASRGITDPARLEDIFMARVIETAARYGKKAAVWNEAVSAAALPKSTVVYGWESLEKARSAAANGYPTVVCAGEYFYFDMKQSKHAVGHIWAGMVSLEKVYSFSPEAVGFTADEARNVVGIEATLFGELMLENGLEYIDYQYFPRICALAEIAWSPVSGRSWEDFKGRLGEPGWQSAGISPVRHYIRLNAMGIKYYDPNDDPMFGLAVQIPAPAAKFTTSFHTNSKTALDDVATYKKAARFPRAPVEGDWFMWRFAEPVSTSRIDVRTGYAHLQRAGFPHGRVEVSYDGQKFETVTEVTYGGRTLKTSPELHDLRATVKLEREKPVRAIRVVCTSHGNGENFTIIQPLKIYN